MSDSLQQLELDASEKSTIGEKSGALRNFAFILQEHFSMLALISAIDVLRTANLLAEKQLYSFQLISIESGSVCGDLGFSTAVDGQIKTLTNDNIDAVVICGGLRVSLEENLQLSAALRHCANKTLAFGSLWNGVFALGYAGLLQQQKCTIHQENKASFREIFPNIHVQDKSYWLDDNHFSCAGGQSALDMMLALIARDQGNQFARGIGDILICDRISAANESADLHHHSLANLPQHLVDVVALMENNMEEMLTMEEIAGLVKITRRQIERLFQRYLGTSPTRYYLELRLKRAHQLLCQTQLATGDIALACGFVSYPHFSKCYSQFYNQPPSYTRKKNMNL